ncbi:MAG: DUF1998 domain-containing protein [Candidatus Bathyarchaeota archaeon]|nr:DUF1998 domain-containing protein [Candidatus Bathyarchaeota archaeon]
MSEIEKLRKMLIELRKKARQDLNVPDELHTELVNTSTALERALEKLAESKHLDASKTKMLFKNAERLSLMLEDIKKGRSAYPSYVDDFVPSIAQGPYTMPRNLFEPQGAQQITVNAGGKLRLERAELALSILFPGSSTFRYGTLPSKIKLGRWSQDGRAHLSSIHDLSPAPEFKIKVRDRVMSVYKPLKLNASLLRSQIALCTTCLSLIDEDETCGHSTVQPHTKLPSNFPIIVKSELGRKMGEDKHLQKPLSFVISKTIFLPNLEVGLAVTGFERTATVRRQQNYRTVRIEYDPPIGIRLCTSGLSFTVNIPTEFLHEVLKNNRMLRRDIIIQLLANRIAELMSRTGIPSYHHELLLSSLVSAIHLDDLIDERTAISNLRSPLAIPDIIAEIDRELVFYESSRPDIAKITEMFTALQIFDITEENLLNKLKITILHSMAHVLLLATAITSGSQLDDLDYLLREETNEVVVFDAVSGGNGSSETAFEFLFEPGQFSVEEYLESEERQEIFKPRNLDETAFELLLPCINGVADRAFLFGKVNPLETEIKRKLTDLKNKASTHAAPIARIKSYGSKSIFPLGIGYHGVDYSQLSMDADRFKETANICLHGCPECISIGRKCHVGSFFEKYNISKIALDELLNYLLKEAIVEAFSESEIRRVLKSQSFAIIKLSCNDEKSCEEAAKELNSKILALSGQDLNGGHIKFAGHWVDVDISSGAVVYYYMLKVI